jgi:urease accessory protein
VITGRARHESTLHADLAQTAELRVREVLVLGRAGERPGRLRAATHVIRDGRPLIRQQLDIGDPTMQDSAAYLAGRRVLGTDILINNDTPQPCGGDWCALTPLAGGGSLATALAHDAVTVQRSLDSMRGGTPAGGNLQSQLPDIDLS